MGFGFADAGFYSYPVMSPLAVGILLVGRTSSLTIPASPTNADVTIPVQHVVDLGDDRSGDRSVRVRA